MSLADILEGAASALPEHADSIRPANGDPFQLLQLLGADAGRRVLEWLLENEPGAGTELALAWLEVDGGPEVLAEVDEDSLPKPGRKGLRKALHRLRSQGVALPQKKKAETVVARLPRIEDDFVAGYVSLLDPRGSRLVYLVEPNPSGGARLFEILLDEHRGIVDFEVYAAGRSKIRRFVKEALERTRFPAVQASPESLRALVARIADRHPPDRALPAAFSEWRSKIAIPGETPGDQAVAALRPDDGQDALARAVDLVKKGTVGPWGPTAAELSDLVESRVGEEAAKEAGEEDWGGLAAELFGGEGAQVCAERFRESAYTLWKLGHEDDSRACLAAALAFVEEGGRNLVAAAMAEVLLSSAVEALRARNTKAEDEE